MGVQSLLETGVTTATGTLEAVPAMPDIKGVVLLKGPIHSNLYYDLYVGYIINDNDSDIPHYLIVNRDYEVVEASSAVLSLAKGAMVDLLKRLEPAQVDDAVDGFLAN
jgi:hypothetical protein